MFTHLEEKKMTFRLNAYYAMLVTEDQVCKGCMDTAAEDPHHF